MESGDTEYDRTCRLICDVLKGHLAEQIDGEAFSKVPIILNKSGHGCGVPAQLWTSEGRMSVEIVE